MSAWDPQLDIVPPSQNFKLADGRTFPSIGQAEVAMGNIEIVEIPQAWRTVDGRVWGSEGEAKRWAAYLHLYQHLLIPWDVARNILDRAPEIKAILDAFT